MQQSKVEMAVDNILDWGNKKTTRPVLPNIWSLEVEAAHPILHALVLTLSKIRIGCSERIDEKSEGGGTTLPEICAKSFISPVHEQIIQTFNEESFNQVSGCLAKHALAAFDVGGVGVDTSNVGVIATPLYVRVVELSLTGMGEECVNMAIKTTKMEPLVSKAVLNQFCSEMTGKDEWEKSLFPESETEGEVPHGIKFLWELLHTQPQDL